MIRWELPRDGPGRSRRLLRADSGFRGAAERDDLFEEAREVGGADWWQTENSRLGGRTPEDVVTKGGPEGEKLVRDVLRSIRYGGWS